jgi:DNA-binding response OmpR family regulator
MSRIRVLVVEQDPTVREGLARLLEIAGFVVATAAARSEQTTTFRPDVVLTDLPRPIDYEGLLERVWKLAKASGSVRT